MNIIKNVQLCRWNKCRNLYQQTTLWWINHSPIFQSSHPHETLTNFLERMVWEPCRVYVNKTARLYLTTDPLWQEQWCEERGDERPRRFREERDGEERELKEDVCGENLSEENSTGAHPPASRHLHRLRGTCHSSEPTHTHTHNHYVFEENYAVVIHVSLHTFVSCGSDIQYRYTVDQWYSAPKVSMWQCFYGLIWMFWFLCLILNVCVCGLQQMWVFDEEIGMNLREITFVPGLYKIFDEILGKNIPSVSLVFLSD